MAVVSLRQFESSADNPGATRRLSIVSRFLAALFCGGSVSGCAVHVGPRRAPQARHAGDDRLGRPDLAVAGRWRDALFHCSVSIASNAAACSCGAAKCGPNRTSPTHVCSPETARANARRAESAHGDARRAGRQADRPAAARGQHTSSRSTAATRPIRRCCAAIDGAKHSIALDDLYLRQRSVGQMFVEALHIAVERGVEVRVLIDDIGSRYTFPSIDRQCWPKRACASQRFLRVVCAGLFRLFQSPQPSQDSRRRWPDRLHRRE